MKMSGLDTVLVVTQTTYEYKYLQGRAHRGGPLWRPAASLVGSMRWQVLQQYSQFSVLQVVTSGINYVDGKQLLLLMQLQEQQRRSRSIPRSWYVRGRGRRMIKMVRPVLFTGLLWLLFQACKMDIMRQGRGSEATEAVFCLQTKKPLHSGSYEHRQGAKNKK